MLIATLVLGISVTTAMFSVLDAVLLRPLPFVDPDRVVVLGGAGFNDLDYWNGIIPLNTLPATIRVGRTWSQTEQRQRRLAEVSPDFSHVRRRNQLREALFDENETIPGRNHVAILSHAFLAAEFQFELVARLVQQFESTVVTLRR